MNDIKNNTFDLFCRVVSLYLRTKHRIQDMTLLSADAYFNRNVKVGNNIVGATFW
jgi:CTP:phosphocholine cytidylyltransferase-like protein